MDEITRIGNYIVIEYDSRILNFPVVSTVFFYDPNTLSYDIRSLATQELVKVLVTDITSISDGVGTYTESTFLAFLRANTGLTIDISSGSDPFIIENIVYVAQKTDLPTAIGGIITLATDKTYILTADIDLTGDRIACGGVVNLFGNSSETSSLTSTGLGIGVPLITTIHSIVLHNITFRNVDTCFDIDGNTNLVALDWRNVNFADIKNVGLINSCDNFIFDTGSFLGSQGLSFTGTVGTIAINNSLLRGIGTAGNIIELGARCIVKRRFRIIYSSIVATSSTVGVNVNSRATIPTEAYILDTVNFSGGGTYLSGLDATSNDALFINCVGIENSAVNGQLYMQGNTTATTVSATNTFYKVDGTTTASADNSKFSHSNNRLTCDATISRKYLIQANLTFIAGANNVCEFGFYDSQLARIRVPSKTKSTVNSGGRAEGVTFFCLVTMVAGDFLEVHASNTSAVTDITVEQLNFIITEIK